MRPCQRGEISPPSCLPLPLRRVNGRAAGPPTRCFLAGARSVAPASINRTGLVRGQRCRNAWTNGAGGAPPRLTTTRPTHARAPLTKLALAAPRSQGPSSSAGAGDPQGAARRKVQRWTPEEHARLLQAVEAQLREQPGAPVRWPAVAALLPGRTGKQCRERYLNTK